MQNEKNEAPKRAWTKPVLMVMGSLLDTRSDAGGDMDIDGLNEDPVLIS